MFNARLLGNSRYHGKPIAAAMSGHDRIRLPEFRPDRSIGERVIAFLTFSNITAVRHLEFLKIFIFGHVAVIEFQICCSISNFIKVGSQLRPEDARNCKMFNGWSLGNARYRGNRIMAATSRTRWDAITHVLLKSVHCWASYCIASSMHSADYAVARCLFFCPSVCLSHADIESKRLYISSKFFFTGE